MTRRAPIVGGWFFPGAQRLLKELPLGTPLLLHPEPTNPADPNAVRVSVEKEGMNPEVLAVCVASLGAEWELLPPIIPIGYIRRDFAPLWKDAAKATLTFSPEGKVQALVS